MGQKVLITAAASGIGLEIARAYAAAGASVFITDISEPAIAAAKQAIPGLQAALCNNASLDDIEQTLPAAVEAMGGLDVLVNNAGISGPTAPVEAMDPEKWEEVLKVDLVGTFNVTRLAIPYLKKNPTASIVIMSSLGGRFGYPNRSPYGVAKAGLISLAKTLAIELGDDNIRVNAIAPGAVGGKRIENVLAGRAQAEGKSVEEERAAMLGIQSLKHFVDPKDIAALCVFLTSDAGKSITGQVLPIDCGALKAS